MAGPRLAGDDGNSGGPSDDPYYMSCEGWREALSALADGEDPGIEPGLVAAHLARCAACRRFHDGVHELRRQSAVRLAPSMPDLSRRIVALDRVADRTSRWIVARGLLVVVGVEIAALSLPALVLGDEEGSSAHAARHLGAFTVAYAAALLVVAVRPARARTVLPVAAVLAGALAVTGVIDVLNGQIPLAGEALHVPEVISVVLVWLLAVPLARPPAGRAAARSGPAVRLAPDPADGAETERRAL